MTGIWKLGGKGQSCDEVCSEVGKKCDLDALLEIKDDKKANEIFEKLPCFSGPKTPMKTSSIKQLMIEFNICIATIRNR